MYVRRGITRRFLLDLGPGGGWGGFWGAFLGWEQRPGFVDGDGFCSLRTVLFIPALLTYPRIRNTIFFRFLIFFFLFGLVHNNSYKDTHTYVTCEAIL